MALRILSPAKVNLFLRVLGKRKDGYHEILSLIQPINLYDEVTIEAGSGDGITVRCTDPTIPQDEGNLAWKAVDTFLRETSLRRSVRVEITKRIPAGAGLGGGSSNASSVLKGLNMLLRTGLSVETLMEMAGTIGSDVPFFIQGGSAVVRGRGEKVERVELYRYHYVLVNPGFHVSTRWVYSNLDLTKSGKDNILIFSKNALDDPLSIKDWLVNDLESVVLRRYPELEEIKELLKKAGALGSLMSGSGATVYGLFVDSREAEYAFERIKREFSGTGYVVFLAQGI